jgi:hypothetical protein
MREYGFTITEHDPDRPWMVLASEHRTIKLPDGLQFFAWGARTVARAAMVGRAGSLAAHPGVAKMICRSEA